MFSKPSVKELLRKYSLVQLYTDTVPAHFQSSTSAAENRRFLQETFKTAQLPLYVILKPLGDGKFDVVSTYDEGRIMHVEAFKDFLRKPQTAAAAVARANDG